MFAPTRSPIVENFLRLLMPPLSDSKTSGELPINSPTIPLRSYCTKTLPYKRDLTNPELDLTLPKENICPSLFLSPSSNRMQTYQGPTKPNSHATFPNWIHLKYFLLESLQARLDQCLSLHLAHNTRPYSEKSSLIIPDSHPPLNPHDHLSFSVAIYVTPRWSHSPDYTLPSEPHISNHRTSRSYPNQEVQRTKSHNSIVEEIQLQPQLTHTLPDETHITKLKKKEKQMATRRSPRLQAKQRTPSSTLKHPDKAKSMTAKIPFDLDINDTPIDTGKALAILQALGLEITNQIQEMIDEAAEQDRRDGVQEETTPTTPLYDNISPLAVLGVDILL